MKTTQSHFVLKNTELSDSFIKGRMDRKRQCHFDSIEINQKTKDMSVHMTDSIALALYLLLRLCVIEITLRKNGAEDNTRCVQDRYSERLLDTIPADDSQTQ